MKKNWERVTRSLGLDLGVRLNITLDEKKLVEDFRRVLRQFHLTSYVPGIPFHHEQWKFISLIGLTGKFNEDKLDKTGRVPPAAYLETEAMQYCPYIKSVLAELDCATYRVKILALEPGGKVPWHEEYTRSFRADLARCHIPILTHPDTYVQIGHRKFTWQPGEIWWGDFTFPHCGYNFGETSRIYICADFVKNDSFKRWVPEKYVHEDGGLKKKIARELCYRLHEMDRAPKWDALKKGAKRIFQSASADPEEDKRQEAPLN